MKGTPAHSEPLRTQIRDVLLQDWDPHNASRSEAARRTYDSYLNPLIEIMANGATDETVMDWLQERERETMCFPSLGRERLRRVARKLLKIMEE